MKNPAATDTPLPLYQARQCFADVINRVVNSHERIRLSRRGDLVAALIPIEDLELLEKLEDRLDLQAARRALKESRGKKLIPWSQVKKRHGL